MFDLQTIDRSLGMRSVDRPYSYNLRTFHDHYGGRDEFPGKTLVIGSHKDGLPYMLDLDNPEPGDALIMGTHNGMYALLSTMCESACTMNSSQTLGFYIISADGRHRYGVRSSHLLGVESPHERGSGELIIELASVVEQRKSGRELGKTIVLVIDDLASLMPMLSDYSVYPNLITLIKSGSKSNIWPFVAINPRDVESNNELYKSFRFIMLQKDDQPDSSHVFSVLIDKKSKPDVYALIP